MPDYFVTWQMTGSTRTNAPDELEAKTRVEAMTDAELVMHSAVQKAQVIATREVEAKK